MPYLGRLPCSRRPPPSAPGRCGAAMRSPACLFTTRTGRQARTRCRWARTAITARMPGIARQRNVPKAGTYYAASCTDGGRLALGLRQRAPCRSGPARRRHLAHPAGGDQPARRADRPLWAAQAVQLPRPDRHSGHQRPRGAGHPRPPASSQGQPITAWRVKNETAPDKAAPPRTRLARAGRDAHNWARMLQRPARLRLVSDDPSGPPGDAPSPAL